MPERIKSRQGEALGKRLEALGQPDLSPDVLPAAPGGPGYGMGEEAAGGMVRPGATKPMIEPKMAGLFGEMARGGQNIPWQELMGAVQGGKDPLEVLALMRAGLPAGQDVSVSVPLGVGPRAGTATIRPTSRAEPRLHYGPGGEIIKETPGEGPGYKQLRPDTPPIPKEPATPEERYVERVRLVDKDKAARMDEILWLVKTGRADLPTQVNYLRILDGIRLLTSAEERPAIMARMQETMAIIDKLQKDVVEKRSPGMSDAAKAVLQRAQADKAAGKPWTREQMDRELEAAGVSRQRPGP